MLWFLSAIVGIWIDRTRMAMPNASRRIEVIKSALTIDFSVIGVSMDRIEMGGRPPTAGDGTPWAGDGPSQAGDLHQSGKA
jgi:hypothetical protein